MTNKDNIILLAELQEAERISARRRRGAPDNDEDDFTIEAAELPADIRLSDFFAYSPDHRYMFVPSGELWPASSIDARLPPVPLLDGDGHPVVDSKGKPTTIKASRWLDQNRAVDQMTWAPGLPLLIENKIIKAGGWKKHPGKRCFNLYLRPTLQHGDPDKAECWLSLLHRVFSDEASHIEKWLAHRVQRPYEKVNHALVLGSKEQGIGKDTILEPVKRAIGSWNFEEVSPQAMVGRFNGYLKNVILRVNEARDLGESDRFKFYDHLKAYTAAPPDVLRVDEKNLKEHSVPNCVGIVITTNHKADGIYLPAEDRRRLVAWSELRQNDFESGYWNKVWSWYDNGGDSHVAAYLAQLDLAGFDPKAPPPKTAAFWEIVDANRAPEDAEMLDAIEAIGNPDALTLQQIAYSKKTGAAFSEWLSDRKHARQIPYRLEACGYAAVRNKGTTGGLWRVSGQRQVIYAKTTLSVRDRFIAAQQLADRTLA